MLGVFFPLGIQSPLRFCTYTTDKGSAPYEKLCGPELFGDGGIRPSQFTECQDEGRYRRHKGTGRCWGQLSN